MTPAAAGECAGVDGCRGGWVVATRAGVRIEPAIASVVQHGYAALAIDMPIGMAARTARRCEAEARRFLSPRGSTLFPTPVRGCLVAGDYAEACSISSAARGVKISRQSWAILPKIAELDAALTRHHSDRVVEAHPECSFLAMNLGRRIASKHTADGIAERRSLVATHLGIDPPSPTRVQGAAASIDDVLDACAMLWTAERFARGEHVTFPADGDELDERGLPMRIVC